MEMYRDTYLLTKTFTQCEDMYVGVYGKVTAFARRGYCQKRHQR